MLHDYSEDVLDISDHSGNFTIIDKPLLHQLELAYQRITYGYDEPDRLAANPSTLKTLAQWLLNIQPKFSGRFNLAELVEDGSLPFGMLHFYVSRRVDMALYHSFLYVKGWGLPMSQEKIGGSY